MELRVLGTEAQLKVALKDVPPGMLPDGIKGGDTKLVWDANNRDERDNAKRTFDDLRGKGYLAFTVKGNGEKGEMITAFDPYAEKLIMTPPMRGGL